MKTRVIDKKDLDAEFDRLLDECGPVWQFNGSSAATFARGSGIRGWARDNGYDPDRVLCLRVRPLNRTSHIMIGIKRNLLGDP